MCASCKPIDAAVGRRIRARRRNLGLTQAGLGAAIGVRFQQIQKYESGVNRLYLATAIKLAKALEWTPCQLVDGLDAEAA